MSHAVWQHVRSSVPQCPRRCVDTVVGPIAGILYCRDTAATDAVATAMRAKASGLRVQHFKRTKQKKEKMRGAHLR